MDKRAQNRSYRSKIWESVNPIGKGWEAIDSEGAEVMDKMRTIDEKIREVATDVKPLIRQAKSALRQRNYLAAGHSIVGFHGRCKLVAHLLSNFEKGIELNHGSFLLNHFEDPYKDELLDSNPDFTIDDETDNLVNATIEFDLLVKKAGPLEWMKDTFINNKDRVTDTASNLFTGEGLGKLLRDKRFNTGFMKKTKIMTTDLVSKSEKMLRDLLAIFSQLEKGVSRRNPRHYSAEARKFINKFNVYHAIFKKYHTEIIVPLKNQRDAAKAQTNKVKEEEQAKQKAQEEVAQEKAYNDYNARIEEEGNQIERTVREQNSRPRQPTTPTYLEPSFDEWKKRNTTESNPTQEEKIKQLDKFKERDDGNENIPFHSQFNDALPEDEEFKSLVDKVKPEEKKEPKIFGPRIPPVGKAAHTNFMDKITIYANEEKVSSFVNELIDYSEQLEETDPDASAKLITIAQNVIEDYKTAGLFDFLKGKPAGSSPAEVSKDEEELPLGIKQLKQKPQDLIDEREKLLRAPKVGLPDGKIDQAYTELGFLRRITPDKMRVTADAGRFMINTFAKRLAKVQGIDDLEPYMDSIEANFVSALKIAIYNGWIIRSEPVSDTFNPHDKYLEIYTRLDLNDISPNLFGVAKLYISCRASADQGTLTVRGIKKHFEINGPKPTSQSPAAPITNPNLQSTQEEPSPITRRSPDSEQENFDENGDEFEDQDDHQDLE